MLQNFIEQSYTIPVAENVFATGWDGDLRESLGALCAAEIGEYLTQGHNPFKVRLHTFLTGIMAASIGHVGATVEIMQMCADIFAWGINPTSDTRKKVLDHGLIVLRDTMPSESYPIVRHRQAMQEGFLVEVWEMARAQRDANDDAFRKHAGLVFKEYVRVCGLWHTFQRRTQRKEQVFKQGRWEYSGSSHDHVTVADAIADAEEELKITIMQLLSSFRERAKRIAA